MKYSFYRSIALTLLFPITITACNGSDGGGGGEEEGAIEDQTILAIYAHPDDEISVGALLARYASEGATVKLAIVTDGRHGGSAPGEEDALAATRALEAMCSAAELGIDDPILMEFEDGEVSENIGAVKSAIATLAADVEPDVIITWGPEGGYGHKDHRLVNTIVTDVFQAGDPEATSWPDSVYFSGVPESQILGFVPISAFGIGIQLLWGATEEKYLQYTISVSDEDIAAAQSAAACHTSQWDESALIDINAMLEASEGMIYLRNALHEGEKRTSLF